ncbi:HU family DNA-binding protein [Bacteroides sp. GD17]|jgi:predicted histone-like DNA-binding protein|uniref:HU family DNA-binding protein n=1 Tax=Bacteroides sp. GD17 TaxID=3139826 RepID=UPI0025E8E482|nr:HU family DNA-binding protein [uncultured Bacteroides sp.]
MPLNYSVAMMGNPINQDEPKKAYAKSQISEELTLKELSRLVASQTTVSRADVSAVLISTVDNLFDGLRAGKQVDFGELGKFRLQITSNGAESAEKFTANNITGVNIQFVPGEDLKNLFAGMEFTPVPTRAAMRAVLRAQKLGQTTVDISKGSTSGGGNNPGGNPDSGNPDGGGSDGDQSENPLG